MSAIHPLALFRLSVLGSLACRDKLTRGELKTLTFALSQNSYQIPGSKRTYLSQKTIERWYYAWLHGGIDALAPNVRRDKHQSQLPEPVKVALITAKKDNPSRSINTLIAMLEKQGIVAKGKLARATVHRYLQHQQLSKRTTADAPTIERRAFVAKHANDIWYGDVLHGPMALTATGLRKTYLVSLMDDASRLITHNAFCLGETARDIEGVLMQALLKHGVPKKLIIDNGPAYRAQSLQGICARLGVRLIYCRPYEPEGKGKLERFHRTLREQFLAEIPTSSPWPLPELNARLWAWLARVYHIRPHLGLADGLCPYTRWLQDDIHIVPVETVTSNVAHLFYHRIKRFIRQDGTLSWEGRLYEVPYEHSGKQVLLVINPHTKTALHLESSEGLHLGAVTPLDKDANLSRKRQRPQVLNDKTSLRATKSLVEQSYEEYMQLFTLPTNAPDGELP